jgi:hypothetical protein
VWFLASLTLAIRTIRGGDMVQNREWMIRAFVVGVAVGTIRIWQAIFVGFGILSFEDALGLTFWIAFSLHVAAAELWLRARPNPLS